MRWRPGQGFVIFPEEFLVPKFQFQLPTMADSRDTDDAHLGESPKKEIKTYTEPTREVQLLGEGSPGVRRIEIIASEFRFIDRIFLFGSIFLVAYVYGLDGTVRYTYQVSPEMRTIVLPYSRS